MNADKEIHFAVPLLKAAPPVKALATYQAPSWAKDIPAGLNHELEIIKNGIVVDVRPFNKLTTSFMSIGRVEDLENSLCLSHPSISRLHSIIQFGAGPEGIGYYLYDLGSTHGTKLNRKPITPKTYYLLKNTYMMQFGASSRFIVFSQVQPEVDPNSEPAPRPTNILDLPPKNIVNQINEERKTRPIEKVEVKKLDYSDYNSRDLFDETPNIETVEDANDMWNEFAKNRKRRMKDEEEDDFFDQTSDYEKAKKKKNEIIPLYDEEPICIKQAKTSLSINEIKKRIHEHEESLKTLRQQLDALKKQYNLDECSFGDFSGMPEIIRHQKNAPKKCGLEIPIPAAKRIYYGQLQSDIKRLEDLQIDVTSCNRQAEDSIPVIELRGEGPPMTSQQIRDLEEKANGGPLDIIIQKINIVDCKDKVERFDFVQIKYVGYKENGVQFHNKEDTVEFQMSTGMSLKGLEKGLMDGCVGDKRKIKIPFNLSRFDNKSPIWKHFPEDDHWISLVVTIEKVTKWSVEEQFRKISKSKAYFDFKDITDFDKYLVTYGKQWPSEDIDKIQAAKYYIKYFDQNNDGHVDLSEYTNTINRDQGEINEAKSKKREGKIVGIRREPGLWWILDLNNNGFIENEEIQKAYHVFEKGQLVYSSEIKMEL
uniref:Peptidylprolyl isomerase n=1 Tax=Rhabditophanes sp. KR3021 TaxID=114890 RepID=A0AC35U933_9BILA